MTNLDKAKLFFRPYLKRTIEDLKRNKIDLSLCREMISDSIPTDNGFILDYFKRFPDRLDSHVFDIIVDTELKMILHDVILRHAFEYLEEEMRATRDY